MDLRQVLKQDDPEPLHYLQEGLKGLIIQHLRVGCPLSLNSRENRKDLLLQLHGRIPASSRQDVHGYTKMTLVKRTIIKS